MTSLITRTAPTMYFVGVTTKQSSIMNVFPKWSAILGLGAELVGYDAPLHASDDVYRAIVQHIKDDPLSLGALVTTHKIDLLAAARDLFDYLDHTRNSAAKFPVFLNRTANCGVMPKTPFPPA